MAVGGRRLVAGRAETIRKGGGGGGQSCRGNAVRRPRGAMRSHHSYDGTVLAVVHEPQDTHGRSPLVLELCGATRTDAEAVAARVARSHRAYDVELDVPADRTPQHRTPDGAPSDGTPQDGAPQDGAPQDGVPDGVRGPAVRAD